MYKGTYCLILHNRGCRASVGSLGEVSFPRGWYVYVGSAQGPGGLLRVKRHMQVASRKNISPRWHIDYLLLHPDVSLSAVACAESRDRQTECAIASVLGGKPVNGFGASDCSCRSHLFYFDSNPEKSVISAFLSLELSVTIKTINNSYVECKNMTVLGISGSMRKDGNTAILVKAILERCEMAGLETEFISLAGKKINPCLGCEKCKEKDWCVVQNDDWGEIMHKVLDAEVLVIGSPTYYYDVCGHLKNFIDRSYSLYHQRKLAGRKAVAVAVCANKGGARTIETLEGFLNSHEFSYLGWVRGKGYLEGDIMKDAPALKKAQEVGDKIVKLLKPHD